VDDSRLDAGEGNTPDSCHLMWSAASAADIANMRSLGFNMDRIGISWANLEPTAPTVNPDGTVTHHWNMRYLAALDGEIKDLHANHMVAILDMHQSGWSPAFANQNQCEGHGLPSWLYTTAQYRADAVGVAQCQFFTDTKEAGLAEKPQEGLAAVWKMLAKRYASDPTVVGADMFNEPDWPASCYQASLRSFYDKVGDAIRNVNKHILLIYEDKAYSVTPPAFLLGRKPALTNAVYSWHFYPTNWSDGRAQLAAHLARARSWDVPLWIGEFDGFGGSDNFHVGPTPDPNWHADLGALMRYLKRNRISWSIWDYDAGGYSVVVPGTTQPKSGLISLLRQDMQ
jgi:endoglycosylceramidase